MYHTQECLSKLHPSPKAYLLYLFCVCSTAVGENIPPPSSRVRKTHRQNTQQQTTPTIIQSALLLELCPRGNVYRFDGARRRRVCRDSELWARTEEKVIGVQFLGVSLGNVVVAGLYCHRYYRPVYNIISMIRWRVCVVIRSRVQFSVSSSIALHHVHVHVSLPRFHHGKWFRVHVFK